MILESCNMYIILYQNLKQFQIYVTMTTQKDSVNMNDISNMHMFFTGFSYIFQPMHLFPLKSHPPYFEGFLRFYMDFSLQTGWSKKVGW